MESTFENLLSTVQNFLSRTEVIGFFRIFEKLAEKYALVVMNYQGICLETVNYLRSVVCKFSPLGVLSGGTPVSTR